MIHRFHRWTQIQTEDRVRNPFWPPPVFGSVSLLICVHLRNRWIIAASGPGADVADSPQADADRKFGYWAGHLVVVGSMIGAGILTTSGYTLRDTGNPTALLGLWTLGGLLALCGAVTVAELERI